jgi:hypothetical protein
LLPAWHKILLNLQMTPMNMPQDICTCWNSTFDMLDYAVVHVGHLLHWKLLTKHDIQDSQGHHFIFLMGDAEPCKGYSHNGFD